jgi:hypothetical protein
VVCKHPFIIKVVYEDTELPPANINNDPTISIHALIDIQSRPGKTLQLQVEVNRALLTALLDSVFRCTVVDVNATALLIAPPTTLSTSMRQRTSVFRCTVVRASVLRWALTID